MDKLLWEKIQQFDFDQPFSEYGFSTRLAKENYWTKVFAQKAILEYKKFMYLAATSGQMVSPSEIVDIVWHQHLIFTQSYSEFCKLLGKTIQHIPSTHNPEEHEKFIQAKEHTKKLYHEAFGEQPAEIWDYKDMYHILGLSKASYKLRTGIIAGLIGMILFFMPLYSIVGTLLVKIDNPDFLAGYFIIAMFIFGLLDLVNEFYLAAIVKRFAESSFIKNLDPYELIFLQKNKLAHVINGHINKMVAAKKVSIEDNNMLILPGAQPSKNVEEFVITNTLKSRGKEYYTIVLGALAAKPVFSNVANSMEAFRKYFNKSKKFARLFYFNFIVLMLLLTPALVRMGLGITAEKKIIYLSVFTLVLIFCIVKFLQRLTYKVAKKAVPVYYKHKLLTQQSSEKKEWDWQYFLYGTTVLVPMFVPVLNHYKKDTWWGSDSACSSGGSCGSSCGSSCGGGCGGCGS